MRRLAGDIAALEGDAARVGTQQPGQGIEEGAFAGAVRADDGVEFAGLDREVDSAERHQPAETLDERLHAQDRTTHVASRVGSGAARAPRRTVPFLHNPVRPSGMSNTRITIMIPIASDQYSVRPLISTSSTT